VNRRYASEITLVEVGSGKRFAPAAAAGTLLSSASLGWRGIIVERHRREAQEVPESYVVGHGLAICTAKEPILFGWKDGKAWREAMWNPGEFHLVTHGQRNTPRWLKTFDAISLVLDPQFVAQVVKAGTAADSVEFAAQRWAYDATVARYAEAFRRELTGETGYGPLYADTLTIGYTLHLLSKYAIAKPKVPLPRGKLNSFQLRRAIEFIQAHLVENVSLLAMAEQANVSAFHFARQFRATVGLPPHQFVLRQRIQRSLGLIKAGKLPLAQIAVESGFHDQSHFTHAFRKVLRVTPAVYSVRR
jgi:AraC family transcriptional regulator